MTLQNKSTGQIICLRYFTGSYLYIEGSSPRTVGDTAKVYSQTFLPVIGIQPRCLNFWFHMYGTNIGVLRVYTKDMTTGNNNQ